MVKSNPFAQHLNPVCKGIGVEEHIAGYALQTPCRNYDKWVDLAERRTFPSSKGDASEGEREWGREKGQGNREGRKKKLGSLPLQTFGPLSAPLPPPCLAPSFSPLAELPHSLCKSRPLLTPFLALFLSARRASLARHSGEKL